LSRTLARRKLEVRERLVDALAADFVRDEAHLARRDANETEFSVHFHKSPHLGAGAFGAAGAAAPGAGLAAAGAAPPAAGAPAAGAPSAAAFLSAGVWPWKVRVRANSPRR